MLSNTPPINESRLTEGVRRHKNPCRSDKLSVGETHLNNFIINILGKANRHLKGTFKKNGVFWGVTQCGLTSQKTPFFIVTAVKTSNLTSLKKLFPNLVVLSTVAAKIGIARMPISKTTNRFSSTAEGLDGL
jgi:hypothetical protein